jgi:multicomponent Na+:H+ antiporter subunit D
MNAHQIGIIIVLLVSTVLNVAYFAPVVVHAFFGKPPSGEHPEEHHEAPPAVLVPLLITAVLSVVVGLYPDFFINLIKGVLPS